MHMHISYEYVRKLVFKYLRYRRLQRTRLPRTGLKLWRFDITISKFWAYFHCACA